MNWKEYLTHRESETHFLVEGALAVQRLIDSDFEVEKVIKIGRDLSRDEASHLLGFQFHRGHLAIAKKRKNPSLTDFGKGTLVILPEIADPGNLGTIIRNTAALGGSGIIIGKGASPYNAKAVRASAGTLFKIPVRLSPNILDDLKILSNHQTLIGASLSSTSRALDRIPRFSRPVTLLLGPEDFGLSQEVESLCEHLVSIPMSRNVDSINVASASAILLHGLAHREMTIE